MKIKIDLLLFIVFSIIAISCSEVSQEFERVQKKAEEGLTENEAKGIQEIVDMYGGICKYSVGFKSSENGEASHHFKISLSNSPGIEIYKKKGLLNLASSNIALTFYKNLNKEELKNYDKIKVNLKPKGDNEKSYSFTKSELLIIKDRVKTIKQIVNDIKNKNFNNIESYLNKETVFKYDQDELVSGVERVDSSLGEISKIHITGFVIYKSNQGNEFAHICGMVSRDIQTHEFSADFSLNNPPDIVEKFEYKY